MIVTCERCSTQFRLDEARIPEAGVRVRCSRCKYAFHVDRPGQSEEARVERAAARALTPEVPETTQDLSDEEADWEFNVERGNAAAEDSPFGAEQSFEHSDEDDTLPDSGLDIGDNTAQTHDAAPAGDLFGDGSEPVGAASGLDLAGSDAAPASEPAAEAPQDAADGAGADALGRPEDWDFFADVPAKTGTGHVAEPVRHARPTLVTPGRAPIALEPEPSEARPRWLVGLGSGAAWLGLAILCLLGLRGGLTPPTPVPVSTTTRLEGAEISDVRGRTIENWVAGDLFVVSAVLRAAGSAPPQISVALLDAAGEPLRRPPVPLGPEPPETLLRLADPAALAQFAERAPLRAARGAQRVAAVIPALPGDARGFRFVTGEAGEPDAPPRESEGALEGLDGEARELPQSPAPDAAG